MLRTLQLVNHMKCMRYRYDVYKGIIMLSYHVQLFM